MPGIQLEVPHYSEPEFLLQAGRERWDVRNRPIGTVAAGYGHEDDAVHDVLMATARYDPLSPDPATVGTLGAGRQAVDVATLPPGGGRVSTWLVTRYDDRSVEFEGPVEKGMTVRYAYGPNPAAPNGYVGGTVVSSTTSSVDLLLVRADGTVTLVQRLFAGVSAPEVALSSVGGAAVAAVSRAASAFAGAPRAPGTPGITDQSPVASTVLVVWRADGQFVPFTISRTEVHRLDPLSNIATSLAGASSTSPATFDFDFSCVSAKRFLPAGDSLNGKVADYLGCGGAEEGGGDPDTISLGRISVAKPQGVVNRFPVFSPPTVAVLTAGDHAVEGSDGLWRMQTETRSDTACSYALQGLGPNATVPVGSFDLRTAFGVTYVGCVEPSGSQLLIREYQQPESALAMTPLGDPIGRTAEVGTVVSRPVERTTFDRMYEPSKANPPASGEVPLQSLTYSNLTQPTLQLQFPCAHLLARPVRAGLSLDDCDTSTPPPDGAQPAGPPPNWTSYSVAAYATVGASDPRLVVSTVPSALPLDRTYLNDQEPSPYGTYGDPRNFSWTVEPAAYRASDLTALRGDQTVDVGSFDVYHAPPAEGAPRLLLAEFNRPARTTVVLDLASPEPHRDTSATVPIAVLQAPPQAGGLGQDELFTPAFGIASSSAEGAVTGRSTSIGTHLGMSAVATLGVGAAGNHVRAGGGYDVDFSFLNEAEQELERVLTVENSAGYGGDFADHTIVTRAQREWVWDGTIRSDPTGLAAGEPFTYRQPSDEIVDSAPLSTLAKTQPTLYGSDGLFRESLDRLVGFTRIGNPGSYLSGADSAQPTSILTEDGGPCKGGYTGPGERSNFTGDLPAVVSPENPFLAEDLPEPTGPNVLLSNEFHVGVANPTAKDATIGITSEATRSTLATTSYDFSATAILKAEAEADAGVSARLEVELRAGLDAGWSETAGVSDTLGTTSELQAHITGIPLDPEVVGNWLSNETYDWRMFMCKAQLGPEGLGHEVWLQGYVTSGYDGVGGLEELGDIELTAPETKALVRAAPGAAPGSPDTSPCTEGPNEFRWKQSTGTVRRYGLEFEPIPLTGDDFSRGVEEWATPEDFLKDTDPRSRCAMVDPGAFVDGQTYRWNVLATAFVPDEDGSMKQVRSPKQRILAEVWPPDQRLRLGTPVVRKNNRVRIPIHDPADVTSLTHQVTVTRVGSSEPVEQRDVGGSYTTRPLAAGTYEVSVDGFNDQVLSDGQRAETPEVTATFTVVPDLVVRNAASVRERRAPAPAVFKIRLSEPSEETIRVSYETGDRSARAGDDYRPKSGVVTFAPGDVVKKVKVRVLQDQLRERVETFILTVSSGDQVDVVDDVGRVKIIDDD